MTTVFEETFPGTGGTTTPWPTDRWTKQYAAFSNSYLQNDMGILSIVNGNTTNYVRQTAITTGPEEFDLYFEIYRNALTGTGVYGASMGWSGSISRGGGVTDGFRFGFSNASTSLTMQRYVNGTATNYSGVFVPSSTTIGARMRQEAAGWKWKMWNLATTEPSTWLLEEADTPLPPGTVSLWGYGLNTSAASITVGFDNLVLEDIGTASTPPFTGWGMRL